MTIEFKPATRPSVVEIPEWSYEQRLLSKVEVDDNGCWIWQASKNRAGYGQTYAWRRGWLAHRLSYTVIVGRIPFGFEIDHLCRTRACINPAHLEPVTKDENLRRQGLAVTRCPRGHKYTPENILRTRTGRACRQCDRARSREWRAAKRQKEGMQ